MGLPRPLVRVATTLTFFAALTAPGPGPLLGGTSQPDAGGEMAAASAAASADTEQDRPWTDTIAQPRGAG